MIVPVAAEERRAAATRRAAWNAVARRPWTPPAARTVVVTPHPDDEVLGCGGLIATQRARDVEVVIVAVTDGEASHASHTGVAGVGQWQLRRRRQHEQQAALDVLGAGRATVHRLGLTDGEVAAAETRLAELLTDVVESDDLLVAPWAHDHHCDHEACGRAARLVAGRCRCITVGSLVWAPTRTDPRAAPPGVLLELSLDRAAQQARLAAIDVHRSQTQPVGGPAVVTHELLAKLSHPTERFVSVWP